MNDTPTSSGRVRTAARLLLGAFLVFAGVGHMTFQREEFQAQVPGWFPLDADLVVLGSGVVEIALGTSLIGWRSRRVQVGWVTAAFFLVIFPGNIAQYMEGTDAFGLDSDSARLTRLFFQPVLIAWALWSTGAWRSWRSPSDTLTQDPAPD
ncbi:MAG: hypothetical protein GY812_07120 [Actinomycetia bacterium]|nr:hypothetical protein [Actinomycetes bacterium]